MFAYRDQPNEPQAGEEKKVMGRGKIEIKKIENQTNRQVTYSKRRNGIFKKAQELTVLCDAKVSIIMISGSRKLHEYISPNITTKKIYDQYQKALNIDLWNTHYERMQESLRKLKDINYKLRREIRQRMGEDLDGLNFDDLHNLEQSMQSSMDAIRERKMHDIKTKTGTSRKKVSSLEQINAELLLQLGAKYDDPHYELVENEPDYDSSITVANGAPVGYPFPLHHHNARQAPGGFGFHQLRLA